MSKQVELTGRRVLGVLVIIGLASAAVGVGTFAAFSDTEESNNNAITTGTLNLTVDGDSSPVTVLSVSNAEPNTTYDGTEITLANDGSLDGTLNISVDSITSSENGIADPEDDVDSSPNTAEIEPNVTVFVRVDGTEEYSGTLDELSDGEQIYSGSLAAGSSTTFNISYEVADAGNVIQSDSASVDFDFDLRS